MLAAPSIAFVGLAGLGALVLLPLRQREIAGAEPLGMRRTAALLAAALGYGVLLDYVLVMLIGSLHEAAMAAGMLAALGVLFGARVFGPRRPWRMDPSWIGALPLLWLLVVVSFRIVADPIENWDSRSIWFFGAKMIFYHGGFDAGTGFELSFHEDYPKLLQTLAGQVAYAAGFWNEYLPKAALLVLLVPALVGYLSFLDRPLSWIFLVGFSFLQLRHLLWNGQADASLALYGALAVLALGRWLQDARSHDLALGIMSIGMVLGLKNEGKPLVLCIIAALCVVVMVQRARGAGRRMSVPWGLAAWLAIASCAAFVLWEVKKSAWGLEGDFALSADTLTQAWERVEAGRFRFVRRFLLEVRGLEHAFPPLILAVLAGLAFRGGRRSGGAEGGVLPLAFWVALLTAAFYLVGIVVAYLGTPHDLRWHLRTSSHRTVLPVFLAIHAATFWALSTFEGSRSPAIGERGRGEGDATSSE